MSGRFCVLRRYERTSVVISVCSREETRGRCHRNISQAGVAPSSTCAPDGRRRSGRLFSEYAAAPAALTLAGPPPSTVLRLECSYLSDASGAPTSKKVPYLLLRVVRHYSLCFPHTFRPICGKGTGRASSGISSEGSSPSRCGCRFAETRPLFRLERTASASGTTSVSGTRAVVNP